MKITKTKLRQIVKEAVLRESKVNELFGFGKKKEAEPEKLRDPEAEADAAYKAKTDKLSDDDLYEQDPWAWEKRMGSKAVKASGGDREKLMKLLEPITAKHKKHPKVKKATFKGPRQGPKPTAKPDSGGLAPDVQRRKDAEAQATMRHNRRRRR